MITLHSAHRRHQAFTLVEMLVVIGIVVLLVSIVVPTIMTSRKKAGRAAISYQINALTTALEEYKNNNGAYPPAQVAGIDACTSLFRALSGTTWNNATKKFDPIINGKSGRPAPVLIQVDAMNVRTDMPSTANPKVVIHDK